MYTTIQDVYDAAGITSDIVGEEVVRKAVLAAEAELDRLTKTTYWVPLSTGTATSATTTTIVDAGQGWGSNTYSGQYVQITGGTGSGQVREILSNTSTSITITRAWATTPDTSSTYSIIYTASPAERNITIDGSGENTLFLDDYPVQVLETLTIDSVSVPVADVTVYSKTGKLRLTSTSAVASFRVHPPQCVALRYWMGVTPMPYEAQRYVQVVAAMRVLTSQVGGTYDDPSSISLPEGSVTVGQAYINIKAAIDLLERERDELKQRLTVYLAVF